MDQDEWVFRISTYVTLREVVKKDTFSVYTRKGSRSTGRTCTERPTDLFYTLQLLFHRRGPSYEERRRRWDSDRLVTSYGGDSSWFLMIKYRGVYSVTILACEWNISLPISSDRDVYTQMFRDIYSVCKKDSQLSLVEGLNYPCRLWDKFLVLSRNLRILCYGFYTKVKVSVRCDYWIQLLHQKVGTELWYIEYNYKIFLSVN